MTVKEYLEYIKKAEDPTWTVAAWCCALHTEKDVPGEKYLNEGDLDGFVSARFYFDPLDDFNAEQYNPDDIETYPALDADLNFSGKETGLSHDELAAELEKLLKEFPKIADDFLNKEIYVYFGLRRFKVLKIVEDPEKDDWGFAFLCNAGERFQ